jgi:hypothetical protein
VPHRRARVEPIPDDVRPGIVKFFQDLEDQLKAIITERDNAAVKRLLTECPPDMPHMELLMKVGQFQAEAAIAEGAGWPNVTAEQVYKAGHRLARVPEHDLPDVPDGMLFYRARPDGDNPDSCFFDICSIARYAPGAEPALKREFYWGVDDWEGRYGGPFRTDPVAGLCKHDRGSQGHEVQWLPWRPYQSSARKRDLQLPFRAARNPVR